MKYAFIHEHRADYAVTTLCRVLEVSSSGFYDWIERPESNRAQENRQLVTKISLCHKASKEIYGSPRIHRDLLVSLG